MLLCSTTKVTLLHGYFFCFSNCTNSPKSRKASHMNSTLFCGAEARILLLILLLYYYYYYHYYYYYYYFQLTQTLVFSNFRLYFLTSVPTELCKDKCGILEDKKKVLTVSIYRSIHNLYIKKYAPKHSVKILEKPNRTRDIWGLLFFFSIFWKRLHNKSS